MGAEKSIVMIYFVEYLLFQVSLIETRKEENLGFNFESVRRKEEKCIKKRRE